MDILTWDRPFGPTFLVDAYRRSWPDSSHTTLWPGISDLTRETQKGSKELSRERKHPSEEISTRSEEHVIDTYIS